MRSFFLEKFQTKRFIKTKILWRLQLDLSRGHDFTVRVGQLEISKNRCWSNSAKLFFRMDPPYFNLNYPYYSSSSYPWFLTPGGLQLQPLRQHSIKTDILWTVPSLMFQ